MFFSVYPEDLFTVRITPPHPPHHHHTRTLKYVEKLAVSTLQSWWDQTANSRGRLTSSKNQEGSWDISSCLRKVAGLWAVLQESHAGGRKQRSWEQAQCPIVGAPKKGALSSFLPTSWDAWSGWGSLGRGVLKGVERCIWELPCRCSCGRPNSSLPSKRTCTSLEGLLCQCPSLQLE